MLFSSFTPLNTFKYNSAVSKPGRNRAGFAPHYLVYTSIPFLVRL
jgi:hypothetical protein